MCHPSYIVKLVPTCVVPATLGMKLQYVIDGGGLLYKFAWPKHSSYTPRKDKAQRHQTGSDVGALVSVSEETRLTMTKKIFMANSVKQAGLDQPSLPAKLHHSWSIQ